MSAIEDLVTELERSYRELQERMSGKVETDFDTARRLFTLICVLQMRG